MEKMEEMESITKSQLAYLKQHYPIEARIWDIMLAKKDAELLDDTNQAGLITSCGQGVVMA